MNPFVSPVSVLACVCLFGSFCLVLAAVICRVTLKPDRATRPIRRLLIATMGLLILTIVFQLIYRRQSVLAVEQAPAALVEKAPADTTDSTDSTDLVRFIKTNKTARLDQAKSLQVQRGPQDAPPSDSPELDAAEIDAACKIAQAMLDADVERLRLIIGAYKYKPYARAQITECLNYSFTMTGMDFRFTFHEFWFFVEPDRKADGIYTIAISAFDPKPDSEVKLPADGSPVVSVLKTTEDKKEPGLFHLDTDETITPAAVLKLFQASMQASAQKKKQPPPAEEPQKK